MVVDQVFSAEKIVHDYSFLRLPSRVTEMFDDAKLEPKYDNIEEYESDLIALHWTLNGNPRSV